MNKKKIILISISVVIVLIVVLVILLMNKSDVTPTSNKKDADKNLLVGSWLRTDAQYVIKINSINDNGTLNAQYFNPKSINVGSAAWEENYGNLRLVIELQDVNYPGSKYTLNYLPDRDILAGDYYQAVQGLNFYVEFARNK
jgi:anionic cell wall polymer biosynthesis LytR-Cps2A-Psr (LCP) family protein